ncbi:putative DeoR family transcriptional regulator, stage III sporulation protein D [Caldanaerobius fijiensis DSM 17918]|uniref:Putative DeoR family transcriptional regulator, stage III sporulation protein D n=1 Tax=Caldanaerobius fijiensis DSM 17918 TaxID=1121256 RepID=A0A1M4US57_9THEO|nr:sporulation transcriptional regulator SpoIIID [Caldanaerobius fijiensis]SHE59463.1 putative DeoR family transcriptional regulator, stage III sporulation protein D [Caldanaerobius fijiensis DSM 17918]
MKGDIDERVIEIARYVISSKATVRKTAIVFGVSKSTVHKDMTERLPKINPELYNGVKDVLEKNKAERHIRGGKATKLKYKNLKHLATEQKDFSELYRIK